MINLLLWSCLLLLSLVAMLLLCRKTYVVYSWASEHSKATREYFYSYREAAERAKQLRQFGYTVIVTEV